jgi:hypothetical protein
MENWRRSGRNLVCQRVRVLLVDLVTIGNADRLEIFVLQRICDFVFQVPQLAQSTQCCDQQLNTNRVQLSFDGSFAKLRWKRATISGSHFLLIIPTQVLETFRLVQVDPRDASHVCPRNVKAIVKRRSCFNAHTK